MSEHDEPGDTPRRPRGRRAAPASRVGALLEPVLPYLAASVAWLTRHRLGAVVATTALAVIGMGAAGIALMQGPAGGAPGNEASTSIDEPRPTSTTPAAPSHYGPVLPTPAPPKPIATTPAPEPDEIVEPPLDGDEPVEPTTTPEDPDDHPGQGKGPKKPRG